LRVEAELAAVEENPVRIALHAATLERYIKTVETLAETMAGHAGAEDDRGPLIADFRALVHSIVVHPKAPRRENWPRW
jgi:site-specific DNA recombinase